MLKRNNKEYEPLLQLAHLYWDNLNLRISEYEVVNLILKL